MQLYLVKPDGVSTATTGTGNLLRLARKLLLMTGPPGAVGDILPSERLRLPENARPKVGQSQSYHASRREPLSSAGRLAADACVRRMMHEGGHHSMASITR
jgi:hypothetical protein